MTARSGSERDQSGEGAGESQAGELVQGAYASPEAAGTASSSDPTA